MEAEIVDNLSTEIICIIDKSGSMDSIKTMLSVDSTRS